MHPKDALFAVDGGQEAYKIYNPREGKNMAHAILPNLAKFIRLTFHDCVKEVTGAGCNGCVNFQGMGAIFRKKSCSSRKNKDACDQVAGGIHPENGPFATDNNNLLWTMKVLEEIYTNARAGEGYITMHYNQSLYDAGKSRADLWAFAGLVALQRSVENNNRDCNPNKPAPCPNQIDENSPDCSIDLPVLNFKTGRSDCIPNCTGDNDYAFCTTSAEIHPNPHGNGTDTNVFFEENFNLSPRETVALMGVHTIGHPEEANSMFRHYGWTPQGRNEFNNQYYINIANATNYRHKSAKQILPDGHKLAHCNLPISNHMGDEYGNPIPVGYKVRSERRTNAFGPWNWALHGSTCSAHVCLQIDPLGISYDRNSCCNWLGYCQKNPDNCPFKMLCGGPDEPECKLYSQFQATSMMSVDMGLHIKFETDSDGRPYGCPGMQSQKWIDNLDKHSDVVQCQLNDEPGDENHTMAELVELFAKDQDVWVNEFTKVYSKMMENGVQVDDLETASSSWMNATCNDKRGECKNN